MRFIESDIHIHTYVYVRTVFTNLIMLYKLNKNTPGVKKSEAKSEAPVSSYSYTQLKSVISGRGQGPNCLLAAM